MWLFDLFFLNSANLICRTTDISKYFGQFLGVRDYKSRLYIYLWMKSLSTILQIFISIMIVSGCDRELIVHFRSAASLKQYVADTWHDSLLSSQHTDITQPVLIPTCTSLMPSPRWKSSIEALLVNQKIYFLISMKHMLWVLSEVLLMSSHNMFLWRNWENYPRIITEYSSFTSSLVVGT